VLIAAALLVPVPLGCTRPTRPNFILIVLDDARVDGVDRMPMVQTRLVPEGVRFENAFTPAAICCPSRASTLTGLYALRHGTRQVGGV
jgi:arylsulfatase A-like enzyme